MIWQNSLPAEPIDPGVRTQKWTAYLAMRWKSSVWTFIPSRWVSATVEKITLHLLLYMGMIRINVWSSYFRGFDCINFEPCLRLQFQSSIAAKLRNQLKFMYTTNTKLAVSQKHLNSEILPFLTNAIGRNVFWRKNRDGNARGSTQLFGAWTKGRNISFIWKMLTIRYQTLLNWVISCRATGLLSGL